MHTHIHGALFALLLVGPAASPGHTQAAPDTIAVGYVAQPLAVPPPVYPSGPFGFPVNGVAATLSTGEVLTCDGDGVYRVSEDGSSTLLLGTISGSPTYPSFVAINPSETLALVGESSLGALYRVDLVSPSVSVIGSAAFNYDAVFEDDANALVSANLSGSFTDNDILRVNVNTGAQTGVCFVEGPSGPLAMDPAGNLYYGLLTTPASVIVWTPDQLASGALLDAESAITLATGFSGASGLAFDPTNGGLYLSSNDWVGGTSRIVQVVADPQSSPVIVDMTDPFAAYFGFLEFVGGTSGAVFGPFQPAEGGTLRYARYPAVGSPSRQAVSPARTQASLSGAGLIGPGPLDYSLEGGVPGGFAYLFFGPTASFALPETAHVYPGAQPLFTGLALGSIEFIASLLPLSPDGSLSLSSYQPGGLLGLVSIQSLVIDAGGLPVGTSTIVHL